MSDNKISSEATNAIHVLLAKAERVSTRVYWSAGLFLILGLMVAGAGVLYFYFSNDAVFLDKAFYQESVNKLTAEGNSVVRDNQLLVTAYNKRAIADSLHINRLNRMEKVNDEIIRSNINFYNDIIKIERNNKLLNKENILIKKVIEHGKKIELLNKKMLLNQSLISQSNASEAEISKILDKYVSSIHNPIKPALTDSPYDKPELVFSPKLVYGFFSRLGGLIFIELIAFYLLKQYRINMNEFKYYDGIARQARVNLYLVDIVERLEDDKSKIDIVSKLFNSVASVSTDMKQDAEEVITSSDIEVAKKLLDSVKDLLKK